MKQVFSSIRLQAFLYKLIFKLLQELHLYFLGNPLHPFFLIGLLTELSYKFRMEMKSSKLAYLILSVPAAHTQSHCNELTEGKVLTSVDL